MRSVRVGFVASQFDFDKSSRDAACRVVADQDEVDARPVCVGRNGACCLDMDLCVVCDHVSKWNFIGLRCSPLEHGAGLRVCQSVGLGDVDDLVGDCCITFFKQFGREGHLHAALIHLERHLADFFDLA